MIKRAIPCLVALVFWSVPAIGADPGLLTLSGTAPRAAASDDPSVVRTWDVAVDPTVLAALTPGGRFRLPIPGLPPIDLVAERVADRGTGGRAIDARIDGHPGGAAVFLVTETGVVNGAVSLPGLGTWRVRPVRGGHVLVEVETDRLPSCGGVPAGSEIPGRTARAGMPLCEDGTRIDVLILYTPIARVQAGGQAAIESEINLAVEVANQAYDNSGIGHHLRVVGLQEIAYDEDGSYNDHLNRLTDPGDGFMDEAHVLRDELSADLVALIVDDGENCGIAWLMPDNSADSENLGFSVTTWYCAADRVLAHELGHNMGACHAPGDGGGCTGGGLYEYSVGYRYNGDSGTLWRTVMAYSPGTGIAYFSSPLIDFDGRPTGTASADNARTLNETTVAIANYRRPACPGNAYDDCEVNFQDILKLLANWGQNGGPSDVNDDGTVDVQDLIFVLQHWGPCVFE